jgi:DMSO/TMAO reductase YedYZ heme-binding membrane subunit
VCAALHFLWLAKVGRKEQYVYAAILALLLGVRAWDGVRRVTRRRATRASAAATSGAAALRIGPPQSGR